MTRSFQSPPGKGVYLSVLLRPQLPPGELMGVTGMAAVAVCRAVERAAGVRPKIKWTNDLVLNGRKLCGILTELALEGETQMTQSLVIGAGVNASHTAEDFGPQVAEMATSLVQEGYAVSRPALAAAMVEEFYRLSESLGGDIREWVDAYRRDCVTLGRRVRLLTANSDWLSVCQTEGRPPCARARSQSGGCTDMRSEADEKTCTHLSRLPGAFPDQTAPVGGPAGAGSCGGATPAGGADSIPPGAGHHGHYPAAGYGPARLHDGDCGGLRL